MAHRIKPEDLEDYIKFITVNRGCPVESVDRNKAHWNFIMNKTVCMEQVNGYRRENQYSCSLCGKRFADRRNRNRHRRNVDCIKKVVKLDKPTVVKNTDTVYRCKMCDKTFSHRSNRDRHQRTMHKPGAD